MGYFLFFLYRGHYYFDDRFIDRLYSCPHQMLKSSFECVLAIQLLTAGREREECSRMVVQFNAAGKRIFVDGHQLVAQWRSNRHRRQKVLHAPGARFADRSGDT